MHKVRYNQQAQRKFKQIKFDNLFRGEYPASKVLLNYLDVKNQVANCDLNFRGFITKITLRVYY